MNTSAIKDLLGLFFIEAVVKLSLGGLGLVSLLIGDDLDQLYLLVDSNSDLLKHGLDLFFDLLVLVCVG